MEESLFILIQWRRISCFADTPLIGRNCPTLGVNPLSNADTTEVDPLHHPNTMDPDH